METKTDINKAVLVIICGIIAVGGSWLIFHYQPEKFEDTSHDSMASPAAANEAASLITGVDSSQ